MQYHEIDWVLKDFHSHNEQNEDICLEVTYVRYLDDDADDEEFYYEYYKDIVNVNDLMNIDPICAPHYMGKPITRDENGKIVISENYKTVNLRKALSLNPTLLKFIKI